MIRSMRFIVYGAGAIGGVLGARLFEAGHEVGIIARGAHLEAIQERGLQVVSVAGSPHLPIPAVGDPAEIDWREDDVVLLAVKSHQSHAALGALAAAAPFDTPIVCLQNGVANEELALRRFSRVYGGLMLFAAVHLDPGVVVAYQWPEAGIVDVGRFPGGAGAGADDLAEEISAACRSATFRSLAVDDIMPWKRRKLVMNLGNGLDIICGFTARDGELGDAVRDEGERAMRAAGLDIVSDAEFDERRSPFIELTTPGGKEFPGSSSWQSAARGTGDNEIDYLNGEIVLLGRLYGVPTPVNELVQHLVHEATAKGLPPGSLREEDLLARL